MKKIKVNKIIGATKLTGKVTTLYETYKEAVAADLDGLADNDFWSDDGKFIGVAAIGDGSWVYVDTDDDFEVLYETAPALTEEQVFNYHKEQINKLIDEVEIDMCRVDVHLDCLIALKRLKYERKG